MEKPSSFFDWELSYHKDDSKNAARKIAQLLKNYFDKKTLYKTAGLSNSSFHLEKLDFQKGILECSIISEDHPRKIKICIDTNKKIISHKCNESKSLNHYSKLFCTHLTKMFLVLQEEEPTEGLLFLEDISAHDYNFFPEL